MSTPDCSLNDAKINIRYCKCLTGSCEKILYKKLADICVSAQRWQIDVLWKSAWSFRPKRPAWCGLLQTVTNGPHPGKPSFHLLPMIDMNPNDLTCVYSTLRFIAKECKRNGATPIITSDQPLWWKSKTVIIREKADSDLRTIVLNLGGFHTIMSYLGSIGHVMRAIGLVPAENAVHMLSGKSYPRAIRGHFLVDTVINVQVIQRAYDLPSLPIGEEENNICIELKDLIDTFDRLLESPDERIINDNETITKVSNHAEIEEKLEGNSYRKVMDTVHVDGGPTPNGPESTAH